jgi:macrolide transport system ATP-binding/permease protein
MDMSRRWRRLVARCRAWLDARYWWKRSQFERDVDDEMRFHIDMEARALQHTHGLSEPRARARALAVFGGQTRFKEEARADLPIQWVSDLGGDVRFAMRSLRRTPLFTMVAVLAMALGIAANTTLFGVVDAAAFQPLDAQEPSDLRAVFGMTSEGSPEVLSFPVYEDIRNNVAGLSDIAAFAERMVSVHGEGQPVAAWAAHTTDNYFSLLGLRSVLGRLLQRGDTRAPVAVLSHAFWTRSFGADPAIIGKKIQVNGFPFTIIGVAPANFHGTRLFTFAPEVYLPIGMHAVTLPGSGDVLHDRSRARFHTVARIREGEGDNQIRRELDALGARLSKEHEAGKVVERIRFGLYSNRTAIEPFLVSPERLALVGRLSLVAGWLVLLIACADVASLLLARMTARRREIATRVALGATRARLVRQLLVESLVLGFLALLASLPIAAVALRASVHLAPPLDFTSSFAPALTSRSVLFTCAVALAAAVLFGLAPLLHAGATSITHSMRGLDGSSRPSASRWRSTLIAAQVATSILVLVTAGLFARSLAAARKIDVGFDADRLVVFTADPSLLLGYDTSRIDALYRRLTDDIAKLPGVDAVARATAIPLDGTTASLRVFDATATFVAGADYYAVSDRYFETMRMPLLSGRALSARDTAGVEQVVVNEILARRLWPDGTFRLGTRARLFAADGPEVEIVGVVGTRTSRHLADKPRPLLWRSLARARVGRTTMIVRVTERPDAVMPAVRRAVQAVAPDLPIVGLRTMREQIALAYSAAEGGAVGGSTLGVVATILAAAGIFGVVAYAASQRVHELGIRRALGAGTPHLLALTLRSALRPTIVGVAIGLASAFALPRGMSAVLYGVSPRDPIALFGAAIGFGLVALVAAFVPAWRATRISPTQALQHE